MDLAAMVEEIRTRLLGRHALPAEAETEKYLDAPIRILTRAGDPLWVHVDAIEAVETPIERQYAFRFHVLPHQQPHSPPVWGREAMAFGHSFDFKPKSSDDLWEARQDRAFWYTFSSRRSLKENAAALAEFVREQWDKPSGHVTDFGPRTS